MDTHYKKAKQEIEGQNSAEAIRWLNGGLALLTILALATGDDEVFAYVVLGLVTLLNIWSIFEDRRRLRAAIEADTAEMKRQPPSN